MKTQGCKTNLTTWPTRARHNQVKRGKWTCLSLRYWTYWKPRDLETVIQTAIHGHPNKYEACDRGAVQYLPQMLDEHELFVNSQASSLRRMDEKNEFTSENEDASIGI